MRLEGRCGQPTGPKVWSTIPNPRKNLENQHFNWRKKAHTNDATIVTVNISRDNYLLTYI
jgi:hypothetical protein